MDVDIRDRAAIVGIGQTAYAKVLPRSEPDMACEAILNACEDAGVAVADIDGIARYDLEPASELSIIYNLGIPNLRFYAGTPSGGGGVASVMALATMAIATGTAETVICYRTRNRHRSATVGPGVVETGRPWERAGTGPPKRSALAGFHHPFGIASPTQENALIARRHMAQYGTRAEHFGMQAVVQRSHASTNPAAMHRDPITLDDWADSRMIADPIRLLDCSLENAGAVAVLVTSAERARDLRQPPVYVMATAQGESPGHYGLPDFFTFGGAFNERDTGGRFIGRELFGRAGIAPSDVDVAMIFDHYTMAVPLSLEQFGFCGTGEGGPFIEDGGTQWPDGALPVNTHGGSTSESSIHGFNHYPEAVRQLRGTAVNQVDGCEVAFLCGAITDPCGALLLHN